ncbi:MAG TPA: GNAT family N-acetyltransferase [Ferruginibacter sp.]|nr:GNAT family N-acetyltransferase [Ferruginibacter sp.]
MLQTIRTTYEHTGFRKLVQELDRYLAVIDGSEHDFYHQYNHVDQLQHVVVLMENEQAMGCGAIKAIEPGVMEVKRMYTLPLARGKGIASRVLTELEAWAAELGYTRCVLETGRRMTDAVSLYRSRGYHEIPNYGPYIGIDNSICFEKQL